MNNPDIIKCLKERNIGMFKTLDNPNEAFTYLETWNNPEAVHAGIFMFNACNNEFIRIMEATAAEIEPDTVTVTMTRKQADALNDFAQEGCNEWENTRDTLYTEQEITDRNEQMDLCDQAQLILIKALQEQTNE